MKFFRTAKQINDFIHDLADLLNDWGLKSNDWMLGKNISLYLAGVLKAEEVERDVTVYIVREKLPFSVDRSARSVIPPAKTRFGEQYNQIQQKHHIGIDLWLAPTKYTKLVEIQRGNYHQVGDATIKSDPIRHYIVRMMRISKDLYRKPANKIRNFYYANEQRYQQRRSEYQKIKAWAKRSEPKIVPEIDQLIRYYDDIIKKSYPEIFERVSHGDVSVLSGIVAERGSSKVVTGEVFVVNSKAPPAGKVLVFKHFIPIHTPLAKKAKAIVTDGGGALSHAAIVSREYHIPCIVATKIATKVLKTGDRVSLDLTKGTVTKVD